MDALRTIIAAVKSPNPVQLRELLRNNPALVNARDETGDTILLMTVYRNLPDIRTIILEHHPDVNLFEAAALGDTAAVRDRLSGFPELVHAFSHDGFTALHLAAFFGKEETAAALLDAGALVDAVSKNQTFAGLATPLQSAVAGRWPGIVRLLLARGADVNARQEGGTTPLHAAAFAGDAGLVELLLRHGADRLLKADDHRTAADVARDKGFQDIAVLLN